MKSSWNIVKKTIALSIPYQIRQVFPECIYKHLHFKGKFSARLNGRVLFELWSNGYMIENQIFWKGIENSHEKLSSKLWIKLIEVLQPQIIWDIGSNTGIYGLLGKTLAPNSRVLLFDPLASAIEFAQLNFIINQLDGEFHNIALGDFSGGAKVFLNKRDTFAYSVTVNRNLLNSTEYSVMRINVRRAEEFVNNSGEIPQLVKIDVETFEPEVLRGFASINLTNTTFLIEILSDEIGQQIQEILTPENFIYVNINDKTDKCRIQKNLSKSDYYNFLIVPRKIHQIQYLQIMSFLESFQI
jgi:FkbM family methyltransferase